MSASKPESVASPQPSARRLLRDADGLWPNLLAVAYILGGYFGGWWALLQASAGWFAFGVLALAHAMTIAGYLMHECGHNAIFRRATYNIALGRFLNMLCGSNYESFETLRYKHMRHHVDNCEPVVFDYRGFLKRHPLLLRVVIALEWAYVPAVELLMHGMQIVAPFIWAHKKAGRARVLRVLAVRGALFALVLWYAPQAALGYVLAYLLFLTILRFFDSLQHSYEIHYRLHDAAFKPPLRGDRHYEQANTYTNLISVRHPWLNLFALNFSYHNAHHTQPVLGFYKLPKLHAELYPNGCPQQFTLWPQLVMFHRHRVARVLAEEYGAHSVVEDLRKGQAVGVNALSFLVAF